MADNDKVTVWGGTPRIARTPSSGQLLVGNGSGFTLTSSSTNMEQTTVGGEPYYGFAGYHGSFYDTQTQPLGGAPTIGTETLVKIRTTDLSYGVSIVSDTQITVANPGVYNLQFSLQVINTTANNKLSYFWLKKNGTAVPETNTEMDLPLKDHGYVASWNFFQALNATNYLEIAWTSDDIGTVLKANAIPTYGPAIPSAIVTMTLVR